VLFASFGGKWTALAGAAIVTAGIMSAAMLFDSKGEERRVRKGRGGYSQGVRKGRSPGPIVTGIRKKTSVARKTQVDDRWDYCQWSHVR
jgi:hypothetical protein